MKKIIAGVMAFFFAAALVGCGNGGSNDTSSGEKANHSGGNIKAGDYVNFGNYNWQVLEVNGSKGLILCERILDYRAYNNDAEATTWAECDLREYLNNDFLLNFNDEERKMILPVINENPDNPWDFSEQGGNNMTDGGADTEDSVFLLDLDDVIKYFSEDGEKSMIYQSQLGAREEKFHDGSEDCRKAYFISGNISNPKSTSWILRTPGMFSDAVVYVGISGAIDMKGVWVEEEKCGIRPAIWIKNINSLERSVVKCNNPDCSACSNGVYRDSPSPDTGCVFCGYRGECTDKEAHSRVYHDWRYNYITITDEMLEEMYRIEEEFRNEWLKLAALLEEGESMVDSTTGNMRIAAVVSNDVRSRILVLEVKEISIRRDYQSMTADQFNETKAYLENRTELLREVEETLNQAIIQANSSSKTFEEKGADLVNAIIVEVVRTRAKLFVSNINESLWNSGYYHKLFGVKNAKFAYYLEDELLQREIDEFFGSNKIEEWGGGKEGTLDEYLKAIFLSDE